MAGSKNLLLGSSLLFFALAAVSTCVNAACHVVTPSGSGSKTGADWNNAYAGLPATLVRGDIYYLADGRYPEYIFNTADSDAALIAIKKAIGSDHCADTGWNPATMGGGQAIFDGNNYGTGFAIHSDYLILDGQVGQGEGTVPYGLKIDDSNNSTECGSDGATFCRDLPIGDTGAVHHITIEYLEIAGACTNFNLAIDPQACDTYADAHSESTIYSHASHLSLLHIYSHHASGEFLQFVGGSNVSIAHSYLYANNSTPTQHANCIGTNASTNNVTVAFNSLHDCEGTSVIVSLNAVHNVYTDNSWVIYGNIVYYTANNGNNRRGVGDGFFGCIAENTCTNFLIYNNTVADMTGPINEPRDGSPTGVTGNIGIVYNASTGNATVENNLWYNNSLTVRLEGSRSMVREDYNTLLKNSASTVTGSHDINLGSGAADPFVNDAGFDFHLVADIDTSAKSGKPLSGGTFLPSPYNIDFDGKTRGANGTWARGAYEFSNGPQRPANLRTTVR